MSSLLKQTRAYAAQYGLIVGSMWSASFLMTVYGLSTPLLSDLGLIVGLMSVYVCIRLMRRFDMSVSRLTALTSWRLAWGAYGGAAMVCTLVQYVYFAFLDSGRVVMAYSELVAMPEGHAMLERLLPGQDVDALVGQALDAFAATPPSQIALQLLLLNLIMATVLALPTALIAMAGRKKVGS